MDIVAAYKKTAVELLKNPDSAEHLSNQLTMLVTKGERNPIHLALARRAVAIAPNEFIAVFNLGGVESRAGFYTQALASFERALTLANDSQKATALHHVGLAWHDLGDMDKAREFYSKARELTPNDQEIRSSVAIARLMAGDLKGLFDFECKHWKSSNKPLATCGIPRWMGEDLRGKTLIVGHEQGYGDTLQFARVIPLLNAERIIWSGPEKLNGLMADNFEFDEIIGEGGPFKADYYCSPISACGALGLEYQHIDSGPYMKADAQKLPERGLLKVGLSWAGNKDYAHDSHRSMKLSDLGPVLSVPGAAFYSLQVGRGEDEISLLGLDGFIANLGGTFRDWRDTARAIMAMDVVIATDSANAHLAGALGKPVLLMLPKSCCWRWLSGDTSPWYKNTRLFRQPVSEDWATPVGRVRDAIESMVDGRRTKAAA